MYHTVDMTKGDPRSLLISFAGPLFIGNVFQALYNVADGAVVGRVLGVDAFACVGAAGFYSWLMASVLLGLTQGFGVLFGQCFGEKDMTRLRKATAISVILSLCIAVPLTLCGQIALPVVLRITDTPEEIQSGTLLYLRWVLMGIPISLAANLAAALLRSLGNSKAPVMAMLTANICNVALDILFAAGFHWGISGVAAATLTAQLVSFFYCFFSLRNTNLLRLSAKDFRWDGSLAAELLRLGLPPALRNGVVSLGSFFVQKQVNQYGTLFIAGVPAANKYLDLLLLAGGALEGAFAAYSAQNYGAKKRSRVKSGMRTAMILALVCSLVTAGLAALFCRFLIRLVVQGTAEEMREIMGSGCVSLIVMAIFLPALYLLCIYRAGLQGMGNAAFPTLSGFTELGLRLAAVMILPRYIGSWGVYLAAPLGWMGAFVLLGTSYYTVFNIKSRLLC